MQPKFCETRKIKSEITLREALTLSGLTWDKPGCLSCIYAKYLLERSSLSKKTDLWAIFVVYHCCYIYYLVIIASFNSGIFPLVPVISRVRNLTAIIKERWKSKTLIHFKGDEAEKSQIWLPINLTAPYFWKACQTLWSARLLLYFKLLDYIHKNKFGYVALPCKEKMSQSQKTDFNGRKVYTFRALCNQAVIK